MQRSQTMCQPLIQWNLQAWRHALGLKALCTFREVQMYKALTIEAGADG